MTCSAKHSLDPVPVDPLICHSVTGVCQKALSCLYVSTMADLTFSFADYHMQDVSEALASDYCASAVDCLVSADALTIAVSELPGV